jgi:hypothetical protein
MPDSVFQSLMVGVVLTVVFGLGLLLIDFTERELARRPEPAEPAVPVEVSGPAIRRHGGHRRAAVGTALSAVALIAVGATFFWVTSDPLHADGPMTGSGPLYLGTIPATYGGKDGVTFATVSGGDIVLAFTLSNSSDFAVTVTGLPDPVTGDASWEGDGLFETGELVPIDQAGSGGFHPFDIAAHSSVAVLLTLRLRSCPEWRATPTLPPGRSPSVAEAMAATGVLGWESIENVDVGYRILGASSDSRLDLPAELTLATADRSGCRSEPNLPGVSSEPSLPDGLSVTPEPTIVYP